MFFDEADAYAAFVEAATPLRVGQPDWLEDNIVTFSDGSRIVMS